MEAVASVVMASMPTHDFHGVCPGGAAEAAYPDDACPAPESSHDGAVTRMTYPHADEIPADEPDSPVYRVARTRAGMSHATMTIRARRTDQPGTFRLTDHPQDLCDSLHAVDYRR